MTDIFSFSFWVLGFGSQFFQFFFLFETYFLFIHIYCWSGYYQGEKKVVFMLNDFAATLACAWS